MSLLEVNKITKRFGGLTAVSEVDFTLEEGAIVSIIGPNGAGKTTFFNMITGIYKADSGSIRFDGKDLANINSEDMAGLGICRTFQNIRLFKSRNALENVLLGMHVYLKSSIPNILLDTKSVMKEERKAIEEALDLLNYVGLKSKANTVAENLPYGEQRRLEIARALASRPRLLLLDEPTAGMNPKETAVMVEFFRRLREEKNVTLLLIEHDMKVVMNISEKILVLDFGTKICEGTPEVIKKDKRVIEAYLGSNAASS